MNNCPLKYVLNLIVGKWRLPIIWALWQNNTLRSNEMKRNVDVIANMILKESFSCEFSDC